MAAFGGYGSSQVVILNDRDKQILSVAKTFLDDMTQAQIGQLFGLLGEKSICYFYSFMMSKYVNTVKIETKVVVLIEEISSTSIRRSIRFFKCFGSGYHTNSMQMAMQ
jgi:hypothetical protein